VLWIRGIGDLRAALRAAHFDGHEGRLYNRPSMDERKLRTLLQRFRAGKIEEDALMRELRALPFGELDFAKVDHHRALRCGFPEVIFCRRKTVPQIARISKEILKHGNDLLATRATPEIHRAVRKIDRRARWHEAAKCVTIGGLEPEGE